MIDVTIGDAVALPLLATLLAEHRGARGEVRAHLLTGDGNRATLLLGRDLLLDGELSDQIERLPGVARVELKSSETRLALVG